VLPARRYIERLRREGLLALGCHLARRALHTVLLRERHIWYALALAGDRPRRDLPAGFQLRPATAADVEAVADLPGQPSAAGLAARLGGTARLYVVDTGGRVAFACTVFAERTPTVASKDGWLDLPPDTVCLEDSSTSPEFRGRGIAPAAWTALADQLARDGYATLVTKIEAANAPSRKAAAKAGFGEAADMRLRRIGPFTRVALSPLGAPGADFVIELLGR
jgi:GNAT superfamily N-acetyltransferase